MPPLNRQLMVMTAERRFESAMRTAPMTERQAQHQVAATIEPICRAICGAHEQWRRQAFFRGITINGPNATGGSLDGPPLEPLIRQGLPPGRGDDPTRRYGEAVATAVGEAWKEFQQSFSVPGLPWYPTFAAVAGPAAPPTPNVPASLSSCTSDRSRIVARALKDRMARKLGRPAPLSAQLFEALAAAFEEAVTQWLSSQMITNVLGQGPVPTFSPPYVPVGPVVMGDNIGTPGHLSA